MRKELQQLYKDIDRIEPSNLYECIAEIKRHMQTLVEWIDKALPEDRSDDL